MGQAGTEQAIENRVGILETKTSSLSSRTSTLEGNVQTLDDTVDGLGRDTENRFGDVENFVGYSTTVNSIFKKVYPIGSIYMSTSGTSPSTLFGGTWTQLQSKFLLAANNTASASATPKYNDTTEGGEATHTLTTAEMPRHSHYQTISNGSWAYDAVYSSGGANSSISGYYIDGSVIKSGKGGRANTEYVGGDGAHNNLPPYLAVYMWKRIA
jgi:hypothetical protein